MAAEEASAVGLNWTFIWLMLLAMRDGVELWKAQVRMLFRKQNCGSKSARFQGTDLAATNTILACAKHFAGYGFAESGRDYNTVDVSETTLQNTIFPPFKAAVDAGVRTL
jgi:beta-glucosidase